MSCSVYFISELEKSTLDNSLFKEGCSILFSNKLWTSLFSFSVISLVEIPVATSETLIEPFKLSSNADPKIIFALESISFLILFAASSTSNKVISDPPVILIKTAWAPFILVSSSRGLLIAVSAASMARLSPDASPVPIMAFPIWLITVLISAKSKLIMPGLTIKSVTPHTPLWRTLSAIPKASAKPVLSLASLKRFWFGITIRVSENFWISCMPSSAIFFLWEPSKSNGFVTTLTVSIPFSLAALAITGAAPVPVPPPSPAVIKTMLLSFNSDKISWIDSSAADFPISGTDPAPNPWVILMPSCIFLFAVEFAKAWPSVLATTNSTPSRFDSIILFTALPPAPPTPITVILGVNSCILSGIAMLSIIVSYKKVKIFIISDFFFDLIKLMKIIINIKFL